MQAKIDESMATVRNITTPIIDAVLEKHEEARQRVADFSVHVGINADTALVVAGGILALVVVLFSCTWRVLVHVRRRSRNRSNRLVVEMAADAPVDDGDEHDLEQRGRLRSAAPGDSDIEEDHFAPPFVPEKGC